jgi:hypothetical protein
LLWAGWISESLTFFNGILELAVFLSHIFKCLETSFSSFFFYFSYSLAIKTYSSFGGLNISFFAPKLPNILSSKFSILSYCLKLCFEFLIKSSSLGILFLNLYLL